MAELVACGCLARWRRKRVAGVSVAEEFVAREILSRFVDGKFVFRGESREFAVPMACVLLRRDFLEHEGDVKKLWANIARRRTFSVFAAEKAIVDDARPYFPGGTRNVDILTDLQHYGGKTTLVDFTRSVYVALFFACSADEYDDGRVYAVEENRFQDLHGEDISYEMQAPVEEAGAGRGRMRREEYLIVPSRKYPRVVFQSSVFVRARSGFVFVPGQARQHKVEVPSDLKAGILRYLERHLNITAATIYNDMHGHIKYQEIATIGELRLLTAELKYASRDYKRAIADLQEVVDDDRVSDDVRKSARYRRGAAWRKMGVAASGDVVRQRQCFDNARVDYKQALALDGGNMRAFRTLSLILKKLAEMADREADKNALYEQALLNLDKAIRLSEETGQPYPVACGSAAVICRAMGDEKRARAYDARKSQRGRRER